MIAESLLTVDRPDGNRIVYRLQPLTDDERATIDRVSPEHPAIDPAAALCVLAEQIHDDEAYRRVCERKGLLPL